MNPSNILLGVIHISICLLGLVSTFFTVLDLTYFISVIRPSEKPSAKDPWLQTSWALLVNMSLLTLFIMQHTLMASQKLKKTLSSYGFHVVYRSLYVIATASVLSIIMKYWHTTPYVVFWNFNLNVKAVWWTYIAVHSLAWMIVYVANICMDVTELLGIKQIYYSLVNLPDPNHRKSYQLQRLNAHMRHPSFLAFLIIFWVYPVMTLDRMLLAGILTSYMYVAWNTDGEDYLYQKAQFERKYHELQYMHRH